MPSNNKEEDLSIPDICQKCGKLLSNGTCANYRCSPQEEKKPYKTCTSVTCPERTGGECTAGQHKEEKKCCIDCKDWAENPKAVRNTCYQCSCHSPQEVQDWEQELQISFMKLGVKLDEEGLDDYEIMQTRQKVEKMIKIVLSRQRTELIEKVKQINTYYGNPREREMIYLDDIIMLIKE